MISSFVILEIYFFIILIADVLFIYLICIREPKTRKLYRLGLIVHWFGAFFQCVTDDFFMFRVNCLCRRPGKKLCKLLNRMRLSEICIFCSCKNNKNLVEIYWRNLPLSLLWAQVSVFF